MISRSGGNGDADDMTAQETAMTAAVRRAAEAQEDGAAWYLVRNVAGAEARAREILTGAGVALYYPCIREMRPVPRKRQSRAQRAAGDAGMKVLESKLRPLWTRYLLVRFTLGDARCHDLFRAVGICGIVGDGGTSAPYPFPHASVAALKSLEVEQGGDWALPESVTVKQIAAALAAVTRASHPQDDGGDLPASPAARRIAFACGETVRIEAGPLAGHTGAIESLPDLPVGRLDESAKVKLAVALLGGVVPVELPLSSIARL